MLPGYELTVYAHYGEREWHLGTRSLQGLFHEVEESPAAGNLHDGHRDARRTGMGEEVGEFLEVHVLAFVELGTGDEEFPPCEELGVESAEGEGRAVGCHQQMGSPEEWCLRMDEVELDGPLGESGRCGDLGWLFCPSMVRATARGTPRRGMEQADR